MPMVSQDVIFLSEDAPSNTYVCGENMIKVLSIVHWVGGHNT